jgi:hypothetical protein
MSRRPLLFAGRTADIGEGCDRLGSARGADAGGADDPGVTVALLHPYSYA